MSISVLTSSQDKSGHAKHVIKLLDISKGLASPQKVLQPFRLLRPCSVQMHPQAKNNRHSAGKGTHAIRACTCSGGMLNPWHTGLQPTVSLHWEGASYPKNMVRARLTPCLNPKEASRCQQAGCGLAHALQLL